MTDSEVFLSGAGYGLAYVALLIAVFYLAILYQHVRKATASARLDRRALRSSR